MPFPALYSYLTGVVKDGSEQKQLLVGRLAEADFVILLLRTFLRAVQNGLIERLAYDCMVCACQRDGVQLHVSIYMVAQWLLLGIFLVLAT